MKRKTTELQKKGNGVYRKTLKELNFKQSVIDDRLDKLTDAVIEGLIDRDIFLRKKTKLIEEQIEILNKIDRIKAEKNGYKNHIDNFFELQKIPILKGNKVNSIKLAETVNFSTSNLFFDNKSVAIQCLLPFTQVLLSKKGSYGEPYRDSLRTKNKEKDEGILWLRYNIDPRKRKKLSKKFDADKLAKSLIRSIY